VGVLLLAVVASMAQEHQEYIQTRVNPTLENLVTQVLLERPDNPVPFMIRWLSEHTKAQVGQTAASLEGQSDPSLRVAEAQQLREEIRRLQAEVQELETKLGEPPMQREEDAEQALEEEEEEEDDDAPDEMPALPEGYQNRGQRSSVSAEAYGAWNQHKAFTPTVHEKSQEQKDRILKVLPQSFLFAHLEKEQTTIIVDAMVERSVEANERLIKEGDDGDVMYVIESGSFDCIKMINGEEQVVKKCGPGDFFGELALLYNTPRAASVEARDPAVLWQLDRETFNHIVRDASMKRREAYDEFLKSVPLLESLGQYERTQLADALQRESFGEGDVVIKRGDDGDKFFIVWSGELTAKKAPKDGTSDAREQDVLSYKKGDYFGELALLHNEARAATVVANNECTLVSLDRKTFKSLLGPLEDRMSKRASEYAP